MIPWRRKWQPTPVFFSGESYRQRRLAGYSPWGRKELDMTKPTISTIGMQLSYSSWLFCSVFFIPFSLCIWVGLCWHIFKFTESLLGHISLLMWLALSKTTSWNEDRSIICVPCRAAVSCLQLWVTESCLSFVWVSLCCVPPPNKIFTSYKTPASKDKEPVSKIHKEFLKIIEEKINTPIKSGSKIWTDTSSKKICR